MITNKIVEASVFECNVVYLEAYSHRYMMELAGLYLN